MRFLITTIAIFFLNLLSNSSFAQDRFKIDSGDTINGNVIGVVNGKLNYMEENNPEFVTKKSKIPFGGIEVKNDNGRVKYYRYRPKPYISLSVGPAVATKSFGELELANRNAGFADGGSAAKLEFGLYFFRNFGVSWRISGHEFEPNFESMYELFNQPGEFIYYSDHWQINYSLFGPTYSGRISNSLMFQIRVLPFGIGRIKKPEWGYQFDNGTGNPVIFVSGGDETLIDRMYDVGATLSYKLTDWLEARLSFDSFRSETKFSYSLITTKANGNIEESIASSTYYVSDFSTSIGFAYTFKRKEFKKL